MNTTNTLLSIEKLIVNNIEGSIKASIDEDGYWAPTGAFARKANPNFPERAVGRYGIKFISAEPPIEDERSDWLLKFEAAGTLKELFDLIDLDTCFEVCLTDSDSLINLDERTYKKRIHSLWFNGMPSDDDLQTLDEHMKKRRLFDLIKHSTES